MEFAPPVLTHRSSLQKMGPVLTARGIQLQIRSRVSVFRKLVSIDRSWALEASAWSVRSRHTQTKRGRNVFSMSVLEDNISTTKGNVHSVRTTFILVRRQESAFKILVIQWLKSLKLMASVELALSTITSKTTNASKTSVIRGLFRNLMANAKHVMITLDLMKSRKSVWLKLVQMGKFWF